MTLLLLVKMRDGDAALCFSFGGSSGATFGGLSGFSYGETSGFTFAGNTVFTYGETAGFTYGGCSNS